MLEGQRYPAGVGIDQLTDSGDAVVQLVQERIDVPLEDRARVSHPQRPASAPQQRRAELSFQPGQRSRDARLGDPLEFADLSHGRAVGDLLEPAEGIGVHFHDLRSWIPSIPVIGRIIADQEHW